MDISFNEIPVDLAVPGHYGEIDNSKAYRGLSGIPIKVLLIGQKLAAAPGEALKPMLITNTDQGNAYFGKGSMLAHMIQRFKAANSYTMVYAIAQADNVAGVAAAGSIAFNGAATASGTLNLYLGGRLVQVGITAADADTVQATKTIAAINANTDLAVTAAIDGVDNKKVNITARHKGECGNRLSILLNYYQDQQTPAGVTPTIVAMAGGTGNPLVTAVIDAIGDEWYTDIVMPYSDTTNIVAMEAELKERFSALGRMDAHCFMSDEGTHSALITKGQNRNNPFISNLPYKGSPTPTYEWVASLAGIASFEIKNDPARPVKELILPGIMPPKVADRFSFDERNLLLLTGMSTFTVDGGGNVVVERIVTTYRENTFAAKDPSFMNFERMRTLTYLRYDWRNFMALTYPRYKLADDGSPSSRGHAIMTPSIGRAAAISRFMLWQEAGLVEDLEQFKDELIVQRNPNNPDRLDFLFPPNIINQFLISASKFEFRV